MPSPITGTVAWTANVSIGVAPLNDANVRLGRGVADAAEAFAYYACQNGTGKVFRLDLSTGLFEVLYGAGFTGLAAGQTGCALSADGTKLWVTTVRLSGTAYILEMATDGSSGSPTTVLTTTDFGLQRPWLDPETGYLFLGDGSRQGLYYTVPGTWAAPAEYWQAPNSIFLGGFGPCRYSPTTKVLAGSDSNYTCWVGEIGRPTLAGTGSIKALAGNGVAGNGGTTGSAYAVATGFCSAIDSDSDGRVYYGEGANRVRRLEGGTISDVVANYAVSGGMFLLPTTGALLVCNGVYNVAKVT